MNERKTRTYSDVLVVDFVAASVRAVAFGASETWAVCVAVDSGSTDRCQRAAAAAVDIAVDSVAIGLPHLVAAVAVAPCCQVRRWPSSCTGCPSWYIVYMASPPHISDADRHMPRKPARLGCVG